MRNQNIVKSAHCGAIFEVLGLQIYFCYIGILIYRLFYSILLIPLVPLTSPRLARIQGMQLLMLYIYVFIFNTSLTDFRVYVTTSLLSVYLQKECILPYPHQNEYLICYQPTNHKGFESLH